MVETSYGDVSKETLDEYKDRLVGRVYKILPMKEEGLKTWDAYIESLLFELVGYKHLITNLESDSDFISLLSILEGLIGEDDISIIRREVFKSLGLVKKM